MRTIALGVDGMELTLRERWIDAGELPNIDPSTKWARSPHELLVVDLGYSVDDTLHRRLAGPPRCDRLRHRQ